VVVYLTFDDYHRTVMMICLRDDILLRLTDYNDDLMCHFLDFSMYFIVVSLYALTLCANVMLN